MNDITITRGFDIAAKGAPRQEIVPAPAGALALLGEDLPGLRPVFHVEEGEPVRAGQSLFSDRRRPGITYTAPAAGTVRSITRGRRRSLDVLLIDAQGEEAVRFDPPKAPDRASVIALLCESGLWPSLRARPFGRIPDPESSPQAIFVTAIDTAPLSPDPAVVIRPHADWFRRGAEALRHLTDGKVYLCARPGADLPTPAGVETAGFKGPHPAGLAGTHIHHLHPVGNGGSVWQIGYQDVIAIGCLFETGQLWTERVVAFAGPLAADPVLLRTRPGADLRELAKGRLREGGARLLSGSPLDGRPARYLGRYHRQVTAMAPRHPYERPKGPLSRLGRFLRTGPPALVPNGAHERAAPARVLPVPFLRAIAIGDLEAARRLGALELVEEDMALLSHLDGHDYGALLRQTLDELEAAQ